MRSSPTADELAYIAGGLVIWEYGDFDLYMVNPPVTRMLAAFPAFIMTTEEGWANLDYDVEDRPEFRCGVELASSHPDTWAAFLVAGRLMFVPFALLGGLICWRWAYELYGRKAACVAVALWCFDPTMLAWNSMIGSDGVATSLGLAAGYAFWRWIRHPTWKRTLITGLALGLAELSKMTWVFLFPLWIAVWVFLRPRQGLTKATGLQLLTILLLGGYVLNMGYAFSGSFQRLGDYEFFSQLLADNASDESEDNSGNRFAGSLFGQIRVPLPDEYVRGADLQKVDFEKGKPSYLLGEWRNHGWWYYYLVGIAVKTPLATLLLGALVVLKRLSLSAARRTRGRNADRGPDFAPRFSWIDEFVLLAPAITLFVFVSSQSGFSCHFRYVLPALPFAFIWISQIAGAIPCRRSIRSYLPAFLLVASISSSLWVYPHSMSYFNAAAGGPLNGHRLMLGSSFAWSQDLFHLRRWLHARLKTELPFVSVLTDLPLEQLGIDTRGRSPALIGKPSRERDTELVGPVPGWHALAVEQICDPKSGHNYFSKLKPTAKAGYSINIYYIGRDEANYLRRTLGLAEIRVRPTSQKEFTNRLVRSAERLDALEIALFAGSREDGEQAPVQRELVARIDECRDLSWNLLTSAAIADGKLAAYDLLLVPGGRASLQAADLGTDGTEKIREFVADGGGYVGICAGSFLGSSAFPWSLGLINAETRTETRFVPGLGHQMWIDRGGGDVVVGLTDNGRRLFQETPPTVQLAYSGGPVFQPGKRTYLPEYTSLASYLSEVSRYEFQEGTMSNTPAVVAAPYGSGKVILFSPHAEMNPKTACLLITAIKAAAREESQISHNVDFSQWGGEGVSP